MTTGNNVDNLNSGVLWHPKVKRSAVKENSMWVAIDKDINLTMKNTFFICSKQGITGLNNILY